MTKGIKAGQGQRELFLWTHIWIRRAIALIGKPLSLSLSLSAAAEIDGWMVPNCHRSYVK
jgi:hypothetical protein